MEKQASIDKFSVNTCKKERCQICGDVISYLDGRICYSCREKAKNNQDVIRTKEELTEAVKSMLSKDSYSYYCLYSAAEKNYINCFDVSAPPASKVFPNMKVLGRHECGKCGELFGKIAERFKKECAGNSYDMYEGLYARVKRYYAETAFTDTDNPLYFLESVCPVCCVVAWLYILFGNKLLCKVMKLDEKQMGALTLSDTFDVIELYCGNYDYNTRYSFFDGIYREFGKDYVNSMMLKKITKTRWEEAFENARCDEVGCCYSDIEQIKKLRAIRDELNDKIFDGCCEVFYYCRDCAKRNALLCGDVEQNYQKYQIGFGFRLDKDDDFYVSYPLQHDASLESEYHTTKYNCVPQFDNTFEACDVDLTDYMIAKNFLINNHDYDALLNTLIKDQKKFSSFSLYYLTKLDVDFALKRVLNINIKYGKAEILKIVDARNNEKCWRNCLTETEVDEVFALIGKDAQVDAEKVYMICNYEFLGGHPLCRLSERLSVENIVAFFSE